MAFNLTTEDHELIVIISGGSVAEGLSMFPALEQNFGGHKVKVDREVKTVVIRSLIVENMEWHQQGTETWPPRASSGPGGGKNPPPSQGRSHRLEIFTLSQKD